MKNSKADNILRPIMPSFKFLKLLAPILFLNPLHNDNCSVVSSAPSYAYNQTLSDKVLYDICIVSGTNGSPINKHPKLEPRHSSSSVKSLKNVSLTPPPVLPPKTRKLQGPGTVTLASASGHVQAGPGVPGPAGTTGSDTGEHNNTTKRQQHQLLAATESFVDDGVSVVRIGTGINRSMSNVGSRVRTRVPKPVRRSKSHLTGKYVTNITHGGSVTLVSLNNQDDVVREFQPIDPDITPR